VGVDVVSPPRREDDVRTAGAAAGQGFWVPALLLVLVHALLTAWRLRTSWWWQDDLVILSRAYGKPLGDLLLSSMNGHVIPGTWLVAWWVNTQDPYAWRWAAGSIWVVVVAVDLALVALLVRLFGARPAALVPLAAYVSSGALLGSTLWWAAAVEWLPVTLSLLLALYFHVGYWRRRRVRDAVGAVLAVVLGLAFMEKAVLVGGALFAFAVLYGADGSLRQRLRTTWGTASRYWTAHLVVAAGYTAFYLSSAEGSGKADTSSSGLLALTRHVVLDTVVPSLFGGPLEWAGRNSGQVPDAPAWFRLTTGLLFAAAVLGSLRRRRGAWRAWVLLLGFTGVTVALLAVSRSGLIGPTIGLDPRYSTDIIAMAVVCVALAWLPTVDEPGAPGDGTGAATRDVPRYRQAAVGTAATAFVVAVLVAGVVSGNRYVGNWAENPTRAYLLTLQQEIASQPVALFDQHAPEQVLEPWFGEERRLSALLRPTGLTPTFRSWQTDLHVVDDTGRIRKATLPGRPASSTTEPLCAPPGQPIRVRLDTPAEPLSTWTMQFGYVVDGATTLQVELGVGSTVIPLEKGLHIVFVQLDGNGDSVVLTPPPDATGMCVNNFVLGTPVLG
jgi:hypothetical protein